MTTEYFTAVSLDGYVADRHGGLDWLTGFPATPAKRDRFDRFFAGVGAMAMGATTYEWILDHEPPDAFRRHYGDTPCWVFTHRTMPVPPGADVRFATGDVRAAHAAMRAVASTVWLVGGGALAAQFAAAGLLDRIHLGVAPVVLGGGTPVLPCRMPDPVRLSRVERDGDVVLLTYDVPPQPGSPRPAS